MPRRAFQPPPPRDTRILVIRRHDRARVGTVSGSRRPAP
jgi:hypothetical protein